MCKVKSVIIAVFIIIPFILGAVVTVKPTGQGGDYDCIQYAIDDIEDETISEDEIHIYPSSGDYWEEDITIDDIDLTIVGIGDVSIKNRYENTTLEYRSTNYHTFRLENLTIENDEDEFVIDIGGPGTGYYDEPDIEIEDCIFECTSGDAEGIVYIDKAKSIIIDGCIFLGSGSDCTVLNTHDAREISITNNEFSEESQTAIQARIPAPGGGRIL
ncbi:MAG: hypothetical protein RAO94_05575 [Candidatus Stygibacter australis]|nr:hypothetical protein [Candidatus Stygibacter australis]